MAHRRAFEESCAAMRRSRLGRCLVPIVLLVTCLIPYTPSRTASAQEVSCANYDEWIWAQTVYESNMTRYAALDPDGDTIACPNLPIKGFAPVLWTNHIPADAVPARVTRIVDGDTFHVSINGQDDTIRMYHMNAPETHSPEKGVECGGADATKYLRFVLGFAPGGTVDLEYDVTKRDQYNRRLAYVWYRVGDDVYLVNEAMVRTGWAESRLYEPDDKYGAQLDAAEQFSVEHVLGVRLECGKFGQPVGIVPSPEQIRQAKKEQPAQGQFIMAAAPTPTALPVQNANAGGVAGTSPQQPAVGSSGSCDPSYPTVCIPPPPPDLDCKDIPYRRFTVLPPDPHRFDGDHDGIGCESG